MKNRRYLWPVLCVCIAMCVSAQSVSAQQAPARDDGTRALVTALPKTAAEFRRFNASELKKLRRRVIDRAVAIAVYDQGTFGSAARAAGNVRMVDQITATKQRVDRILADTLALRAEFARLAAGPDRREAIRRFLATTSGLIDLSARLRYLLYDVVSEAAFETEPQPHARDALIGLLARRKSSIGAEALSMWLEPESEYKPDVATQFKLLQLFVKAREHDLVPVVAQYIKKPRPPQAVVYAAEVLKHLGLPQQHRPGAGRNSVKPPITAPELLAIVRSIDAQALSESLRQRHATLLKWLRERAKKGVTGGSYRLGEFAVEPGDWLLMRNPSPYNLFTDLSPGLFTHVGVITDEVGTDGLRRIVLVDLPERGTHIPATTIDTYVQRTLNYIVLRHPDAKVARKMAAVARSVIGNESQFDLNFRTERLAKLKGKPLAGRKIHTYCAGLLLLSAQDTGRKRTEFFPIPEYPAGGKTVANLAKLGLSFGDDLISPTGALFSSKMQIVGSKKPTYSPAREIEAVAFDHFAKRLVDSKLEATVDLYKTLRLKVAEAAKSNPLLAKAMARAVHVSESTDLVAAAKAAAVVETLDEVAYAASGDFETAQMAITAGPLSELASEGWTKSEISDARKMRVLHADLFQAWNADELSPRGLRIALVRYYSKQARTNIDRRFFQSGQ